MPEPPFAEHFSQSFSPLTHFFSRGVDEEGGGMCAGGDVEKTPHKSRESGFSTVSLKACHHCAPTAPSTTR